MKNKGSFAHFQISPAPSLRTTGKHENVHRPAYDRDKDICFGSIETGKWMPVRLEAGQLMVLWPEDGHAPKLAVGESSPVMKIIVKVAV